MCFFRHWAVVRKTRRPELSVASGRKALGNKLSLSISVTARNRRQSAMIDLAPLGYVLYATAALAFIWLLQNAAQL